MANIDWGRIQSMLGGPDKAFENVAGTVGAFLKSKGEADRDDRNRAATNEQHRANLLQNHSQFAARLAAELQAGRRGENLNRAVQAMNASKLGENENFATRNRVLSHVLPQMRGGNFRPGDASVARAMGSGGSNPFANGIPPELLSAINERSTANAIAGRNRQLLNVDPNATIADFGAMGFSDEDAAGYGDGLQSHRQGLLDAQGAEQNELDQTIQRALMQDYEGIMRLPGDPTEQEEEKKGFWGKLGGALKFAAPIAAAFIPGIGPIASAALAGGGSAAGSLLQGDSISQALLSGGLGAASGYGAKRLPRRPTHVPPMGAG